MKQRECLGSIKHDTPLTLAVPSCALKNQWLVMVGCFVDFFNADFIGIMLFS